MKRLGFVLAVVLLMVAVGLPPGSATAAGEPAEPSTRCESPRAAVYGLLYWLQEEHNDPGRASVCLDRSGLKKPATTAPARAVKLKKVLDAKGLWVVLSDIPEENDYKDDKEKHRYELFPRELDGIVYERADDGRWLLTPSSVERVEKLYRSTFPLGLDDLVEALPDWLRSRVLGISLWQLAGLLLLIILSLALQKLLVLVILKYLRRVIRRFHIEWLDAAVERAGGPLGTMLVAGIVSVAFPILRFSPKLNLMVGLAASILAGFSLIWLAYRLIDVVAGVMEERAERTETKLDDQLVPLVRKTLKLFVVIVGVIFILQNLDVDVGSLLAGLGLGGLAFALAAKDTVANLFGSLMIFIDKPFQIGDAVNVAGIEGSIEEVGFRTSRIRTWYDSLVTIPNARITDSAIDNLGMRRYRRYSTKLGLTYDTPAEKVQAFCEGVRAIIQANPDLRQDSYYVEFEGYGDSALEILLYCFMEVPDRAGELRARTRLNLEILRFAEALGVEFAFPSRTVYMAPSDGPGGPTPQPEELARLVESFGPAGDRGRPEAVKITEGHYPKTED